MRNIAAFPLAIPLMAGPGAITATVLLAGRAGGDPVRLAVLLGVIAAVMRLPGRVPRWPAASSGCSAPPAMWCCRGCSACCWRRLRCNSSIDGVRAALAG